jgi:hypothetical protein
MNTVWVLISLVYSGHYVNTIVPTMEFSTQQKCESAIVVFEQDSRGKSGAARFRCVKIEK